MGQGVYYLALCYDEGYLFEGVIYSTKSEHRGLTAVKGEFPGVI